MCVRVSCVCFLYLWANYRKLVARIPSRATVFFIRCSRLWDDWIQINKPLDPTRDVYIPFHRLERNVQNFTLQVTKEECIYTMLFMMNIEYIFTCWNEQSI
jgi:hypothetical protein